MNIFRSSGSCRQHVLGSTPFLSDFTMPNTLAHFGVQGLLGHWFLPWCDPKWLLVGCVIPDVPWILQRVVHLLSVPIDLYDLRLYAICQASLFGCVVLAGGHSLFFHAPEKSVWCSGDQCLRASPLGFLTA